MAYLPQTHWWTWTSSFMEMIFHVGSETSPFLWIWERLRQYCYLPSTMKIEGFGLTSRKQHPLHFYAPNNSYIFHISNHKAPLIFLCCYLSCFVLISITSMPWKERCKVWLSVKLSSKLKIQWEGRLVSHLQCSNWTNKACQVIKCCLYTSH